MQPRPMANPSHPLVATKAQKESSKSWLYLDERVDHVDEASGGGGHERVHGDARADEVGAHEDGGQGSLALQRSLHDGLLAGRLRRPRAHQQLRHLRAPLPRRGRRRVPTEHLAVHVRALRLHTDKNR